MKLVVVDDDPIQRKLVLVRLQRDGHEVILATDGEDALRVIRETKPDAVVSDVVMPKLDGLALCRAIRKDPAIQNTPVLLVTNAQPETADRELARRAGARDLFFRTPDLGEVRAALTAMSAA